MTKIFISLITLGFSFQTYAAIYGLRTISSDYTAQKSSVEEVTNLPPVMSQDTLGICYAYAASTMLTAENCRKLKTDCRTVSPKDTFSPLGLTPLGASAESNGSSGAKKDYSEGGATANILQRVLYENSMSPSEDCLSLDRILSKVGGAQQGTEIQEKIWESMKKQYEDFQKIDQKCTTCTANFFSTANDQLNQDFGIKKTNEELLRAFASDSYTEFLNQLFRTKECYRAKGSAVFEGTKDTLGFGFYPQEKTGNYDGAIAAIKKVLGTGRPLSLANICLEKDPTAKCENMHGLVVAGYRKVCNTKNECRDAIKVINSWGEAWQKSNDDGWIDAHEALDRTLYRKLSLSWFTDKKTN